MNTEKIYKKLINEYIDESEVVMAEFLAWKKVPRGMTFEDAFEMYIRAMKEATGDQFYVVKEGETEEL